MKPGLGINDITIPDFIFSFFHPRHILHKSRRGVQEKYTEKEEIKRTKPFWDIVERERRRKIEGRLGFLQYTLKIDQLVESEFENWTCTWRIIRKMRMDAQFPDTRHSQ